MKRVFLYAYDRANLGDDLFVHTITKRYPNTRFYMWTDKRNKAVFRTLKNLKIVDNESCFVRLLQRVRPSLIARYRAWLETRCAAVVYIGGSIFMEYPNWQQLLTWWEYEADNRPFYVLGANFGPYKTEAYRDKIAEIYAKMRDVCFRDTYSKQLFSKVNSVRQAPDILFTYPMPNVEVDEKQLFVSVIDCASRDDSHALSDHDASYIEKLTNLLRGYIRDGYTPILTSFCEEEGDSKAIRKILDTLDESERTAVKTLVYDGTNSDAVIAALARSGYVIATRFHAAILGLAAGRPVLPLIYSNKTRNVLDDLGFNGIVWDIRESHSWDYAESRKNLDERDFSLPETVKEEAKQHFKKLDEVLCE